MILLKLAFFLDLFNKYFLNSYYVPSTVKIVLHSLQINGRLVTQLSREETKLRLGAFWL